MWFFGGLLGASGMGMVGWVLFRLVTHNLPHAIGVLAFSGLMLFAVLVGFLAGAAICRRAARNREHLGLFATIAGAVAGGSVGAACAVTITGAYLASYSTWPDDRLDQVLVLLSYPVFGALGLCLGALCGLVVGLVAGGVLRLLLPPRLERSTLRSF